MEIDKETLSVGKIVLLVVAIISYVAWFYQAVIIPINNIQITQGQILTSLQDNKTFQENIANRVSTLEKLTEKK